MVLESEEVSSSEHGDGTGSKGGSGHGGSVEHSSVANGLDVSSVGFSGDTKAKLVVSLNLLNLGSAHSLDLLEDDPLDSFSARGLGP